MASAANSIAVSIKIPGCSKPVLLNNIIRLQGYGNYTWLHRQSHPKPTLITKNLKWFEDSLPDFLRLHKSDLINPSYIQKYAFYNATTLEVSMPDEQIIRVSRRRIDPVLIKLRHYQPAVC